MQKLPEAPNRKRSEHAQNGTLSAEKKKKPVLFQH